MAAEGRTQPKGGSMKALVALETALAALGVAALVARNVAR